MPAAAGAGITVAQFKVYKNETGDLRAVKIGVDSEVLFIPALWMISRKLYLPMIAYLFASNIIEASVSRIPGVVGLLLLAAYIVSRIYIGYRGNAFFERYLIRQGYADVDCFEAAHKLDVEANLDALRETSGET